MHWKFRCVRIRKIRNQRRGALGRSMAEKQRSLPFLKEEGDMRKYNCIFKIVFVVALTCFNAGLLAQENNNLKAIKNALDMLPKQTKKPIPCSELVRNLAPSDVPGLLDIVLDRTSPLRSSAFRAIDCLNLDQTQNDRLIQYAVQNIPSFNYVEQTGDSFVMGIRDYVIRHYKQTNNDELLKPFRVLYEDKSCSDGCKSSLMVLLTKTDSDKNIELYNKIINDPSSPRGLKANAVFGLVQSGSVSSLPYLKEMAGHLWDAEKDPEAIMYYVEAVARLGMLSSKYYEASKTIQEIVEKVCDIDADKYGPMLKNSRNVMRLFDALKRNSSEENRQYLKKIVDGQCKYPKAKEWANKALGLLGNETSLDPIIIVQ
jgi:hypothetical protein